MHPNFSNKIALLLSMLLYHTLKKLIKFNYFWGKKRMLWLFIHMHSLSSNAL